MYCLSSRAERCKDSSNTSSVSKTSRVHVTLTYLFRHLHISISDNIG